MHMFFICSSTVILDQFSSIYLRKSPIAHDWRKFFWKIIWVKLKIHIFPWAKVYQHLNMNLWYIYNAYIVTCRINMENLRYVYLKRFMMQLYLLNQSINQINFIFKNKLIWVFFLSLSVSPVVTMRAGQKMGDWWGAQLHLI